MPLTKVQINRAVSNGADRNVLVEARRVVGRRAVVVYFVVLTLGVTYLYVILISSFTLSGWLACTYFDRLQLPWRTFWSSILALNSRVGGFCYT